MQAKFTQGSILRHVCVMTFASTAGMFSLFFVDLMDMYWLSLLGEVELIAAMGYASSILFVTLSLSIGLSIATAALVSKSVGEGKQSYTKTLIGNLLLAIFAITLPVALLVITVLEPVLTWLGAKGDTLDFAMRYLLVVLPSMPLLALAMAGNGVSRAVGSARYAMSITFIGSGVNAIFDPLFIFGLGWGVEGAAVATALSRIAMVGFMLWVLIVKLDMISMLKLSRLQEDLSRYASIAIPAMLTNLSSPIAVIYVTATMAQFSDAAVAGNAIITRIQPLAFAGLFALSGAVGPIVGQNLGAGYMARIWETLRQTLKFIFIYCVVACGLLAVLSEPLVWAFNAQGETADLIRWFCWGLSVVFVFNGITFCTNAFFNNLNAAKLATILNFAKATVFTMPFVYVGAQWWGQIGVLVGLILGAALVAALGFWILYLRLKALSLST